MNKISDKTAEYIAQLSRYKDLLRTNKELNWMRFYKDASGNDSTLSLSTINQW
jgi:hypothetical protein